MKLTSLIDKIDTPDFKTTLKLAIAAIPAESLPLQQALAYSSYVSKSPFSPVILAFNEEQDKLIVKAGIFYTGIIAGCSCSDDPSPTDEQNEYCELEFVIQKSDGSFTTMLLK